MSSEPVEGGPLKVKDEEDLDKILEVNKEFLVVATFVAPWSQNCANMIDLTREFVNDPELKRVLFVEVTAEDFPRTCSKLSVRSVPSVLFFREKNVVDRMVGADVRNFASKVMQLAGDAPDVSGMPTKSIPDILPKPSTPVSLNELLKQLINKAPIMVFMKGNPSQPRCGFSRQIIQIIQETTLPFETFDILEDEEVRQGLKTFSSWHTYPQVYVKGELIGGLDVIRELNEMGTLKETLNGEC